MKGLEIVSNFDELQLLSNRHAFRILKELQKEPMSGVQLADKLGMKTPRTIYYLKKLEKAGLARQVPRRPEHGYREKYYSAVAQDFLISAGPEGMGESDNGIVNSLSNTYLEYFLSRDLDLDLDEFARVVIEDYLRILPGEKVVIAFEGQSMEIYLKLIIHLRRLGAGYRTIVKDPVLERDMLLNLPEKKIRKYYDDIAETVAWSDAWIDLKRSTIPGIEGIPVERLDLITEERRRALADLNRKEGTRAIVISIPRFEERFHTDPLILEKLSAFWKAVSAGSNEFRVANEIAGKVRKLDNFTIHTGTDKDHVLTVSVHREKCFLDTGPFTASTVNDLFLVPSGEIAFVPHLTGLSGSMYFDYCEMGASLAKGITLEVENGIVTGCEVEDESGEDRLKDYFKHVQLPGKTIGQVGFGLNPAAESISCIPRLDTKVFGSFHLTFGDNTAIGGAQSWYTTWDMIAGRPEVYSNAKLILSNGVFEI
ncbi:MAG: aminopeptidase [Candidatus Sabulitectum sp.]|nr:aminopeptidase [Candidatus Sabulitectum sp.]